MGGAKCTWGGFTAALHWPPPTHPPLSHACAPTPLLTRAHPPPAPPAARSTRLPAPAALTTTSTESKAWVAKPWAWLTTRAVL